MADKQKIIRIFIGSPGGLEEERRAAHEAVTSVNRSHSDHWALQFKLLGWEEVIPGYVRPQDKINEDLDKSDYFIGVLWNKWGSSPTKDPKGPKSGFEEEYQRAESRIKAGLMRDMALYFKKVSVPAGLEPDEGFRKVLDFRDQCIRDKTPFFKEFDSPNVFRDLVREKLEEIGWRETEALISATADSSRSTKPPAQELELDEQPSVGTRLFDPEASKFLHKLTQRSSDWDGTSAQEVARLRLIGTAIKRPGNDHFYLSNHDANLIYKHYRNSGLSQQEVRALSDCGVAGFQHQNVPLWHWISQDNGEHSAWGRVKVLALFGTDTEKQQAMEILALLEEDVPYIDDLVDRRGTLSIWLSDKSDTHVFESALSFLASTAVPEDIPLIEDLSKETTPSRRMQIDSAIVGILSRSDLYSALKMIIEKEISKVDAQLCDSLFRSPQSLTTDILRRCLYASSDHIRLNAARVLFERGEISADVAHALLTDDNYEIRFLAAATLHKLGRPLEDELVKKALRSFKRSTGLLGLFSPTETDDSYYERYQEAAAAGVSFDALQMKAEQSEPSDFQSISLLMKSYPRKNQSFIRLNLVDCFRTYLDQRAARHAKQLGNFDKAERSVARGTDFVQIRVCSAAVTALAELGDPSDLHLIRSVVDSCAVHGGAAIFTYFRRFGDWSDIPRIVGLGGTASDRSLFIRKTEFAELKAAAVLSVGKARVADLLELDLPHEVRIHVTKLVPNKLIAALSDDLLVRELESEDDEYRIVFALRCVQALTKGRLTALLTRYLGGSTHRYYNSIHWLDLGVSLPTRVAKGVAERVLNRH